MPRVNRDPRIALRTWKAASKSLVLHAVLLLVWITQVDVGKLAEGPGPQVVRAVAYVDAASPPPPPAPSVPPPPEPEPPEAEEPAPESEAPSAPTRARREDARPAPPRPAAKGPPPPPPPCEGCAMTTELSPADVDPVDAEAAGGSASVPMGVPGGTEGGVLGGVPGGVVGGEIGGELGAPLPTAPRSAPGSAPPRPKPKRLKPIRDVMSHAWHSPNPSMKRLAMTKTGQGSRKRGESRVAFCVDERGRTRDVRTTKKFPNDPEVDAICRQAVRTWRFRPFKVGRRRVSVCSVVVFDIDFAPRARSRGRAPR